jgi:hypothetical protein
MSSIDVQAQYTAAIHKGRRLCHELNSLSRSAQIHNPSMQSLYKIESNPLRANVSEKIQTALAACGLSTSNMVYIDVTSSAEGEVAYSNHIDGKSGILVCSENIKERDENPQDKKLWPSEILWQSWIMVAKGKGSRASDLKAIVRFFVVNEATQNVIWQAARFSTFTREGQDHHIEYTDEDHEYHDILESVNGASSMRMLLNHKAAVGYRTVERVMILGHKDLTMSRPEARSFILLLSPRRNPPTSIPRPPSTTRRTIPLERSSSGSGENIRFGSAT